MTSTSSRPRRHRSSTISSSYASHAVNSPSISTDHGHKKESALADVSHRGRSRRMSEASSASRYSRESWKSSSSSETVRPQGRKSRTQSTDTSTLPPLSAGQTSTPSNTASLQTSSVRPFYSGSDRPISISKDLVPFLKEYFGPAFEGIPSPTTNSARSRPLSAISVHSHPSPTPNHRLSLIIQDGTRLEDHLDILQKLQDRKDYHQVVEKGKIFVSKVSDGIKRLDSSLKDTPYVHSTVYNAALGAVNLRVAAFNTSVDTEPTGNTLALLSALWYSYEQYQKVCSDISGMKAPVPPVQDLYANQSRAELDRVPNTKQRKGVLGLINRLAISATPGQTLRREDSEATLVQATVVPSARDALEGVTDLTRTQPTFSLSAAQLDLLSRPSTETLVSGVIRSSSPESDRSVHSYASSESFSLLEAPRNAGQHKVARSKAAFTRPNLKTRSEVTMIRYSRPSRASSVSGSRVSSHRSSSNSSVRSSSSISTVKSGSSSTKFRVIEPDTPTVPRSNSMPDFALSPRSSRSVSRSTVSKGRSTSSLRSSSIPSTYSGRSIRSSERRLASPMERISSESSCDSLPSTFELCCDSLSDSDSDLVSDSDIHAAHRPRSPLRSRPTRDTITSFVLEKIDSNGVLEDLRNVSTPTNRTRQINLSSSNSPLSVPEIGSNYAGSIIGYDLVFEEREVFAATIPALVRFLTAPGGQFLDGSKFDVLDTLFIFFRSVTTPNYFFWLLKSCYVEEMPSDLSEDRCDAWTRDRTFIKREVMQILLTWLKEYWDPSKDAAVSQDISDFAQEVAKNNQDPFTQSLVTHLLEYVDTNSRGQYPYYLEESIRRGELNRRSFSNARITKTQANIFFHGADAEQFARALTAIESDYFHSFPLEQIVRFRETDHLPPELLEWERFTGSFFCWVYALLTERDDLQDGFKRTLQDYELLIDVAMECQNLRNYNSAYNLTTILRSRVIAKALYKSASKEHRKTLRELHKFYDAPTFSHYSAALVNDFGPAIPVIRLVRADIQKAEELFASYIGVVANDTQTNWSEPMFEVGRYTYYRTIFRVLEQCYAKHELPKDDAAVAWIKSNCKRYDEDELKEIIVKSSV